jgi:hypothetical protein
MKVLTVILIAALFVFANLKLRTKRSLGQDCDGAHWCDGDLKCRDYRCATKNTAEDQIAWAPNGLKCDWFHKCKDHFECTEHRCIAKI